jgi:hypothetical protein
MTRLRDLAIGAAIGLLILATLAFAASVLASLGSGCH